MLKIKSTNKFKKDLKLAIRRGYDIKLIDDVISILSKQQPLDEKYKDHSLSGEYSGFRECHITPDWLFIYQIQKDELILYLSRTGTHSDLF